MTESVKVRASSLSSLFDCPARWEAIHLKKMFMPSNGKAVLGRAVHASTAEYDKSTLECDNPSLSLSISDAAGAAVDLIQDPGEDVVWDDDMNKACVELIALSLHGKYCREIAPQQTYVAVEVECEALDLSDLGICLTGTTDRIRRTDEGSGIADLKTGKSIVSADGDVNTKGSAYQLGVYEILASKASGIEIDAPAQIIGLQTAKTDRGQRVATGEITGASDLLIGSEEEPGVLEMAAQIIKSGVFFGNPKSMMCSERYCPAFSKCRYRL